MPSFTYEFIVDAPLKAVADFHSDTRALKSLTPPPLVAQIHHYEPLAEGSEANFTLWLGPFPIHWKAIHSHVTANGFTDTQLRGPLKCWQHQHLFTPVNAGQTLVSEKIDYQYKEGIRGVLGKLLFSKPGLYLLFTARKLITRHRIPSMRRAQRENER